MWLNGIWIYQIQNDPNSCVPLKDFKCCTAIRRTVSLSSFRFIALHMGSMEDNSVMYAFILSLLLFSISLWFCLRTERVILSVQSKENVCNMRLYYIFWPFFYPCKEIFSLTIRIIPPPTNHQLNHLQILHIFCNRLLTV